MKPTGFAFDKLVNTRYFQEAAINYKKNGGRYTKAPKGHPDWVSFWAEQERRCRVGYKVGDLWIPGRHYHYLNYSPIKRAVEGHDTKIFDFPAFTELDYLWYQFKHISWHGGEFLGVENNSKKHLVVLKTRRAGFSWKAAHDGFYNYNFKPRSKSFYVASHSAYLEGEGILPKVQTFINFHNQNTDGYWLKNQHKKKELYHQKASYLDSKGTERGFQSEIMGRIIDNANKARGIDGDLVNLEEFGSFPGGSTALSIIKPAVTDSGTYSGQIVAWGTGGEEGPSIQALEDLFTYPEPEDFMSFPNVWDEDAEHERCGFFVPAYMIHWDLHDAHGNLDRKTAITRELDERAKLISKPKKLDERKAEFPLFTHEALQRSQSNGFCIACIDAQVKRILTSPDIQGRILHGEIAATPEGVEFVPGINKHPPITKYPHDYKKDDLNGCITVYEKPFRLPDGSVPPDLYVIAVDPYYLDDAKDLTSLFSVGVWKRANMYEQSFTRMKVAGYIGRPKDLFDAYTRLFNLCRLYNAKAQSEIAGGGKGIVDFARQQHLLEWLEYTPESMSSRDNTYTRNKSYFISMPPETKRMGLTYLIDWSNASRGFNEAGNPITTIYDNYDLGFLSEMRKFNAEKGNFDRISEAIIAMFQLKDYEIQGLSTGQPLSPDSFFNRTLYGNPQITNTDSWAPSNGGIVQPYETAFKNSITVTPSW